MELSDLINALAWGSTKGPSKERNYSKPPYDGAFSDPRMEALFQEWYFDQAKKSGINTNPDDPEHFYNYRAAFLNSPGPGEDGHWPSQYKMIGHPTEFLPAPEYGPGYIKNTRTNEFFLKPEYWEKGKGIKDYTNVPGMKPRRVK